MPSISNSFAWRRAFLVALGALSIVSAHARPLAAQGTGAAVEVVVRDEQGAALEDVDVLVPALGRSANTGADGRATLARLPAGRHELRVVHAGYAPEWRQVELAANHAGRVEVVLIRTPLSLPGLQVTATPTGRDPLAVTQSTSQLAGRELEREMAGTVAQTLRMQPGVAVRSMGPAASMPIVRGLTGDRVLVLQDGQRSADLAGSADDHGITIDPLTAQRVEVVRGPATLLYGNNALGGVVNIITADIPSGSLRRPEGLLGIQSESAFPGGAASLRASAPLSESWVVTARAGGRGTSDMRIPNDPLLGDRLENTGAHSWSGALGIGHAGERLTGGATVRGYQFAYGLPTPPGTGAVRLNGRRYEGAARWEGVLSSPLFHSIRAEGTLQDYLHDEVDRDSSRVLQTFALQTQAASVQLRQGRLGPLSEGAWGVSLLRKDYAATGPEALTPAAESRGLGAFGFQEIALPAKLALQLGGRFDHFRIASRESAKFGQGRERAFHAVSGAVGVRVPLAEGASGAINVSSSFRAPTVEELFSRAAHAGTGAVELGNPELRAERGLSMEGVLRVSDARWNGQLAAYHSTIANFVHLVAEGDTVLYGATLPVLRYAQEEAVLMGVEGAVEWALSRTLVVGALGDVVRARMADGTPLSYMPPPRLGLSLRWEDDAVSIGGDLHHELAQHRVGAAGESPTPPHTLGRLHAGFRFRTGQRTHSLSIRAENLTNELHREATSRVKDFAPGPGRNLALMYRLYY